MTTLNEGSTAEVEVEAGRVLTVKTQGRARVYRRVGLSDAGQYDAPVVGGEDEFGPLPLDATYTIEALDGDAEYTVAWPLVPSLPFRRNDEGAIDAVMDGGTAIPLAADPGDVTVDWDDVQGKPDFGTAALADAGDFATAAQGNAADSAVQPGDLAAVATSGEYGDLLNPPTLGTAAAADTGDFATAAQGAAADTAVQPGDLPTFGTAASADVGDFLAAPSGEVPAYSVDPADLAAALVRAGLMQAGD